MELELVVEQKTSAIYAMKNGRNIAKRSVNTTDIVCENEEHNVEVIWDTLLKCED